MVFARDTNDNLDIYPLTFAEYHNLMFINNSFKISFMHIKSRYL